MNYQIRLAFILITAIPSILLAQDDFSPASESLKLFNKYKPVIESKNNAIVDDPIIIIGDINGDHRKDCIVSFFMTSKVGGNAIIGHECAIYLNIGTGMKVVGAFPELGFCYTLDFIKDQVIYGREYKCQHPYNEVIRKRKFSYKEGKIKVIL